MPWKNPRCSECHGRTRQGEIVDERRCYYVCRDRDCGHRQIGWRHKKRDVVRDTIFRRAVEIARADKRRRLKQ